jgi:NAD(P)H dehydrogenase (quinone)
MEAHPMYSRTAVLLPLLLGLMAVLPNTGFAQKVLVVYYSAGGHTKLMADAVVSGAEAVPGSQVRLRTIDEASHEDLLWADAILVGSPVYAANVAAPVVEFLASLPWGNQMKDKIGAAFVTAGGISAGEEFAQIGILRMMLIYNMIVVGGESWSDAFGASGITEEEPFADTQDQAWVDPIFLSKGTALGTRVAELAQRIAAGTRD